ncbi:MAG TPA: rhodanese-like domain-containing protein [Rhodanobacteraceae bacterium]|nr:rhodanese-like domain-containing protein [Rhodanobacteraceae bacterium]
MSGKSAAQLVAEAKARIDNLTPDQVEAELKQGAVLIDVREAAERAQAAIAGSLHIPRGLLEFQADPASPAHPAALDPHRRVILHCASGGRSALAAATLQQLGYTNVAHLDGGMKAWLAADKPVVKG